MKDKEPRIQVWGVSKDGDGYAQDLGLYDDIYDISIRTGMFSPDMVITFEYEILPREDELSQEDIDELTNDKRVAEAEGRDRSFYSMFENDDRSIDEQLDNLSI